MMRALASLTLCVLSAAALSGCAASRSVNYDGGGNPGGDAWVAEQIPPRPSGREKIPVGVLIGIDKEVISAYPMLKENNIGLGIDYIVREELNNSGWFTICAVDPEMIVAFEKLKDYYWHGNVPDAKSVSSQKPEYILMVGVTRVDLIGKERIVGGSKRFNGDCEVKVNFENYPLLSSYANIQSVVSGTGSITVREVDSIFAGGEQLRSSKFGIATERAIQNSVARLIRSF